MKKIGYLPVKQVVYEIRIGTRLLRDYRLRIDFPSRTIAIEKT